MYFILYKCFHTEYDAQMRNVPNVANWNITGRAATIDGINKYNNTQSELLNTQLCCPRSTICSFLTPVPYPLHNAPTMEDMVASESNTIPSILVSTRI